MGHRFPLQGSPVIKSYLLVSFAATLLFLDGLHTADTEQWAKHGQRIAIDADVHNGFSHVRRISPRVLHKRSVPVQTTFRPAEKGNHLDEISVELPLDSTLVWLDLRLNWDLMTDGYFERYQRNGSDIVHKPTKLTADLCHYQGKIRGKPTSWAAVSTCNGISGVVFDGEHLHHLEPLWSREFNSSSKELSPWETLHYHHADLRRNLACDHHGEMAESEKGFVRKNSQSLVSTLKGLPSSDAVEVPPATVKATSKVKRGVKTDSYQDPFDSNGKSRYVEMVIVVDNKKYKELGSDLKKTVTRTKEISNIVNALYAPLNIYIALVGIVVWTEMDEIELTSKGDETLAHFLHYRRERLVKDHPNDNAQLLTAVEFENGVVGKAMQGPICSYKYSGGVNSDYKAVTGVVATTIAHELGHNFGMAHDGEDCKCPGPSGRCIMSASSSSNRTSHWSSCSLENLAFAFDHGMDYCLRNKPKRLFESPVCGNGFTEEGEECDCGIADSESCRKNTCCDPNTCRLYSNATCGAGTCCDVSTCHYKAGGTVCRASSNTCDLPEFCSGESEFCPSDVFKLNGLACETPNGQAYCYEGKCRTHTDQCILLWGPSGNNSDNLCYQKNVNGSRYGNCGYNLITGAYTPCQSEDTKCGLLHCRYLQEKLEFGYEPVAQLSSFFVNAQGNIHPCRSVSVDFGTQDVDPGLAPDGAKCGKDKMCVNQKCVSVESLVAPFKCPGGCGPNGVCNSKGHCHCDEGYGGSTCSDSGFGGSIDSGPAIDPYATSIFAKSLYVTFLGFIPLIAIISFYVYYANENFKKLCQRGRAVARPRNRQNNNKPQANGGVALRSLEISNPSSTAAGNNNTKLTTPDDFFGKYKGFSLAPLKQPPPEINSNGFVPHDTVDSVEKSVNNNSGSPPSTVRAPTTSTVSSAVNTNVYYSPLPTQTINETLVKNRNDKPTIKSYTNSFLPKNMTRVSWAQPIAQPLPTNSPGSEDESGVTNDSPLYSNIPLTPVDGTKPRPLSSPDPLNGNKPSAVGESTEGKVTQDELRLAEAGGVGGEKSRGSALSRIAGAFPFVRNSLRNLTSHHHDDVTSTKSGSTISKQGNRKNLEISTPILQPDSMQVNKLQNLISISQDSKLEDDVDNSNVTPSGTRKTNKGRYANVPLIDESPVKVPATTEDKQWPKSVVVDVQKAKSDGAKSQERKPVLRAHSMIQPNRNSMHTSNANYNSLRRSRPSVPPPKPPGAPPPPPTTAAATAGNPPPPVVVPSPSLVPKARSESPPPITKPKSVLRPPVTGSNISSILKSFGRNSPIRSGSPAPASESTPRGPAPIAKLDIDPQSPSSPPTADSTGQTDNIYDEIKDSKDEASKSEEKIETLSTGSSESAGGLLSEIIFEIQNRNKESIYNSVDRRKKKREGALEKEKPPVAENKPSLQLSKRPSPKMSPKFKTKPIIPAQPLVKPVFKDALKSSPNAKSPPAPATVFNKLSTLKKEDSPSPPRGTNTLTTSSTSKAPTGSTGPTLLSTTTTATTTTSSGKPSSTISSSTPPSVPSAPPPTSTAKPTCAVNGVPKVTSSPSYVAKINYFSNLSANKNDSPMKPLNSLNTTLTDSKKAVASSIYAPSSIAAPEPSHLSTIRPTYARPYVNNNKLAGDVTNENDGSAIRTAGIFAPNTSSDYGTLGRNKGRKILEEKAPEVKPPSQPPPPSTQQGYKSFNPYLNRPLTFSTFRPNSSTTPPPSEKSEPSASASSSQSPVTSTKASLAFSNPKPVTVNVCSVSKPTYGTENSRGVMRSPARVAQ